MMVGASNLHGLDQIQAPVFLLFYRLRVNGTVLGAMEDLGTNDTGKVPWKNSQRIKAMFPTN